MRKYIVHKAIKKYTKKFDIDSLKIKEYPLFHTFIERNENA